MPDPVPPKTSSPRSKTPPFLSYENTAIPGIIVLFYALSFLAFFPEIFTKVYIGLGDDWSQFYSRSVFLKYYLKQGIFPLWNPFVLCGTPSGLDSISQFSFHNLLVFFLDPPAAWNLNHWATSTLSGFVTFYLLRNRLSLSAPSAFLGGFILMALSMNLDADNTAYFMLPLLFLLADLWVQKKDFFWCLLLAAATALYFLNANPQYILYTCLYILLYLWLSFRNQTKSKFGFPGACFLKSLSPFGIALGLCAFQIFPIYELLSVSHRDMAVQHRNYMLFPTDLIQMIYPDFYKSAAHPELNFISSRFGSGVIALLFGRDAVLQIYAPYAGILPLLLSFIMLAKKQKTFTEKFLLYTSAGVLLYVMGNPFLRRITQFIPILKELPHVGRSYNLYFLNVSILSAMTFEIFWRDQFSGSFDRTKLKKIFLGFAGLLGVLFALKLAITFAFQAAQPKISELANQILLPVIQKQPFYKTSLEFYKERVAQFLDFVRYWAMPWDGSFMGPSLLLGTSLVLLNQRFFKKISKKMFAAGLFLILCLDAKMHYAGVSLYTPEDLKPLRQEAAFLQKQPGLFRVMPLQPDWDPNRSPLTDSISVDTRQILLRPESNLMYSPPLATAEGYRSLIPLRYTQFIKLLTGEPPHGWLVGEFQRLNKPFANLANVGYVITPKGKKLEKEHYRAVFENGRNVIWKNDDALNRAFFVNKIRTFDHEQDVLKEMESGKIDFSKEALLEIPSSRVPPADQDQKNISGKTKVDIRRYAPDEISVRVRTSSEGFLILSDSYDPGWKAKVDGIPSPIRRADYVFRAVAVKSGDHQIEFRYKPRSREIGAWTSGLFLAAGLLLSLRGIKNQAPKTVR